MSTAYRVPPMLQPLAYSRPFETVGGVVNLRDPGWNNTTVLRGGVVEEVGGLKEQDGGPILVAGSTTLVHTLLEEGLVDELRLMVLPVTIGSGLRVFPETTRKTSWRLVDTQSFPTTVKVDTYHPA